MSHDSLHRNNYIWSHPMARKPSAILNASCIYCRGASFTNTETNHAVITVFLFCHRPLNLISMEVVEKEEDFKYCYLSSHLVQKEGKEVLAEGSYHHNLFQIEASNAYLEEETFCQNHLFPNGKSHGTSMAVI